MNDPLLKFEENQEAPGSHRHCCHLVKKLAMRLQIWCALHRRSAHFVRRRRDPGSRNVLFLPDLSSAVYFLLSREKNLLYIIRLTQEVMKTTLEGVRPFVIKDQFAADFRWWLEPIEKCILIGNIYAENSVKIHFYVQTTVFVLFHLSHLILIAPRTV